MCKYQRIVKILFLLLILLTKSVWKVFQIKTVWKLLENYYMLLEYDINFSVVL